MFAVRDVTETVSINARPAVNSPDGRDDESLGLEIRNQTFKNWAVQRWCKLSCIPIAVILILILVFVVLSPSLGRTADKHFSNSTNPGNDTGLNCMDGCRMSLVETIPSRLVYPNGSISHPSTYHTWMELIASAQSSIEVASFRWNLRRQDGFPEDSAKEGEDVLEALLEAGRDRGVRLKLLQPIVSHSKSNPDSTYLSEKANAQVRNLNVSRLLGSGRPHTKLWLIDRNHVYFGTANVEWRSVTHFQESGLLAWNCSCLANDFAKIFDVYWKLSEEEKIPATWPESLTTKINAENPINFTLDDNKYQAFVTSTPPQFSPRGRSSDLDGIFHCIDKAEKFIYIALTDYIPMIVFTPEVKFWPNIDDALRSAAIDRRIHIRMLISCTTRSRSATGNFLKSLTALTKSYENVKIEVKRFTIPAVQFDKEEIAGVNHNKFMVTDTSAFIGTSNWSGDYFVRTTGIGMVIDDVGRQNNNSIRQQLEDIFLRNWNSQYAHSPNEIHPDDKGTA